MLKNISLVFLFYLFVHSVQGRSEESYFKQLFNKSSLGYESAKMTSNNVRSSQKSGLQKSLIFASLAGDLERENEDLQFFYNLRFSQKLFQNKNVPKTHPQFLINSLALEKGLGSHHKFSFGFKKYSFSETFGPSIMNLPNTTDFSEFPFDDTEESKLPVQVIDYSFQKENTKLLLIYSLKTPSNLYPDKDSPYNPAEGIPFEKDHHSRYFTNEEYGGRLTHLFDFGLDLGVIYYRHYPRIETSYYDPIMMKFVPSREILNSYGITHSYDFDGIIFRGDTLFQPKSFATLPDHPEQAIYPHNRVKLIYGLDKTFDNLTTLGLQLHYDSFHDLLWSSAQIKLYFFNERLEVSPMIFTGLNNNDLWIRPKMSYHLTESSRMELSYDFFVKKTSKSLDSKHTYLTPYSHKEQLRFSLIYFL